MGYYEEWNDLIGNQTDESFAGFWEKYSDTEKRIYSDILGGKKEKIKGTFKELSDKYEAEPALFMGFLDGINSSLKKELEIKDAQDDTNISFDIDFEKLYFNMHKAEAEHLYTLPQWDGVLSEEKRFEIADEYKKSKTVIKEKEPGRNDPCPCGSGKKYKKCCGKAV